MDFDGVDPRFQDIKNVLANPSKSTTFLNKRKSMEFWIPSDFDGFFKIQIEYHQILIDFLKSKLNTLRF